MTTLPKPHLFKPEESKPLRWGVFGAGWIAEQMIKTAQSRPTHPTSGRLEVGLRSVHR